MFEPEIEAAAKSIQGTVEAGENNPLKHAFFVADGIERMLERYFPDLATANALDPQETVEKLLELYDAVHGDTANPVEQPTE